MSKDKNTQNAMANSMIQVQLRRCVKTKNFVLTQSTISYYGRGRGGDHLNLTQRLQ